MKKLKLGTLNQLQVHLGILKIYQAIPESSHFGAMPCVMDHVSFWGQTFWTGHKTVRAIWMWGYVKAVNGVM